MKRKWRKTFNSRVEEIRIKFFLSGRQTRTHRQNYKLNPQTLKEEARKRK